MLKLVNHMQLFGLIILIIFFTPSDQKPYSCDPNAECGCSIRPESISRIVNGEDAAIENWGWMVSLFLHNDKKETSFCGGSIISSSWILTAAHCMKDMSASGIAVSAGSEQLWTGTQIHTVSKIIIHSAYNPDTWENDIALLELTVPLNMTYPNIATICIPSVNVSALDNNEWPAAETTVTAIGWGRLAENAGISRILQEVTLQTVDYRAPKCNTTIHNRHLQLCAGVPNDDKDTCAGDSGGPLMMLTSQKQWVLVGLTSYGQGCAEKGHAGVYTRVAVYENWIKQNTNQSYAKVKDLQKYADTATKSSANAIVTKNYSKLFGALFFFLSLVMNF